MDINFYVYCIPVEDDYTMLKVYACTLKRGFLEDFNFHHIKRITLLP